MIETDGVTIERIAARLGPDAIAESGGDPRTSAAVEATGFPIRRVVPSGMSLFDFVLPCVQDVASGADIKGVIAATFSNEARFPSLAVRVASAISLPVATPAFDIQMACSAYPYALYLAGKMAHDLGGRILVVDADIQTHFIDGSDIATRLVMDDAATATLVAPGDGRSRFDFFSLFDPEALSCQSDGPVRMDGFKVFSFVAMQVKKFLAPFGHDFDFFVPHRANLYMVRRLAKSLGLEGKLLAPEGGFANPGSASIPATLAASARPGTALLAGFGAGLSASAATVALADSFTAHML